MLQSASKVRETRYNSRRTGTREHTTNRGQVYAEGGDRGPLWARSIRWDRTDKRCWMGLCCVMGTSWRDGIAIGLGGNSTYQETSHRRRQQGSARSERGAFGDVLPPWQIEGSSATTCCSIKRAVCKPASSACTAIKHATRPARAHLPDHLRSAAMPECTVKTTARQQGGFVSKEL